jgi:hypothetical protein
MKNICGELFQRPLRDELILSANQTLRVWLISGVASRPRRLCPQKITPAAAASRRN